MMTANEKSRREREEDAKVVAKIQAVRGAQHQDGGEASVRAGSQLESQIISSIWIREEAGGRAGGRTHGRPSWLAS